MSSETAIAPRRLHPAGIAVLGIGALRDLAVPLGIAFASMVLGGGGGGQPLLRALGFGVLGVVVSVGLGYARWATTRWSIGDGTIRLRTGVLSERETDVPLARIQAIDTVHGPVQRLFGIRGVHVQTAGGGKAGEITLPALTAADVELLRRAVRGGSELEAPPAPLVERRLSRRRLLLAALTAGQLGVILPLLAAVPQLGEELWGGDLERAGREGLGLVPGSALEWVLAGAALLAIAWLLSTAGAVVAFARFTVTRDADDRIRIRRGLLAHREATVPVARVQAVRIVEGLLRQPFGLVTLRVEVAGYAKEAAAAQTLFPLLRRAEVAPFLAALLPEAGVADVGALEGAPRRALRRYVVPWLALSLPVAAALWFLVAWWPVLLLAPAAWYGVACWRAAGWRLDGGFLAVRYRMLARTTVVARVARLQEHGVRQTVLQRRGGLADLEVAVGAGTRGRVRHLDAGVAGRLFDALRRPVALGSGAGGGAGNRVH
jgi:putative membrane protein